MSLKGPLLQAVDIGEALGWPTRRARRWLQKSGAGRKVGGRWCTTQERMIAHWPDLWELVALRIGADEYDDAAE